MSTSDLPDWERVLSAAARLQQILPDAVLVGGTATAVHVQHRLSRDADHVLVDLRSHFDQILTDLESVAGWETARVNRPVQILGSLDGIETGVRQLIRTQPLETMQVSFRGHEITVPTEGEMLRIKAALILKRNATRDYIDYAALADHLGPLATAQALTRLDELYPQPSGESAVHQLQVQLANPMPFDLEETNLAEYKELDAKWHDWRRIRAVCAQTATAVFDHIAGRRSGQQPTDRPPTELY